jgi:hypothetical protein
MFVLLSVLNTVLLAVLASNVTNVFENLTSKGCQIFFIGHMKACRGVFFILESI